MFPDSCIGSHRFKVVRASSSRLRFECALAKTGEAPKRHVRFLRVRRRFVLGLDLCETPIHEQFCSRDVAAVVRCEKHHGFGDLVGCTEPSGTLVTTCPEAVHQVGSMARGAELGAQLELSRIFTRLEIEDNVARGPGRGRRTRGLGKQRSSDGEPEQPEHLFLTISRGQN